MGTTLNVSAAESNSNTQFKPLSEITTDELTIFALNFARDFEPTITLDINEIIPLNYRIDFLHLHKLKIPSLDFLL